MKSLEYLVRLDGGIEQEAEEQVNHHTDRVRRAGCTHRAVSVTSAFFCLFGCPACDAQLASMSAPPALV